MPMILSSVKDRLVCVCVCTDKNPEKGILKMGDFICQFERKNAHFEKKKKSVLEKMTNFENIFFRIFVSAHTH